jgi:DMSO/TMAO reductase YedYZ molybdopterin-dependent catalytic subunit
MTERFDSSQETQRVPRRMAALAGLVAAAGALAVGELGGGLLAGAVSPVAAVGSAVIDLAPPGSKELVVSLFGTNDKLALTVLIAGIVLAAGAGVGLLARRSIGGADAVIVAIAGIGLLAAMRDPTASLSLVAVVAALQAAAGIWVLSVLFAAARLPAPAAAVASVASSMTAAASRRGFLLRAGLLGTLALAGGGLGRFLADRRAAGVATAAATIPDAVDPAGTPPPDASFAVAGLTPLVVPNDRFYRIDTALITPAVDVKGWTLRVHGMVDREVTLTFAQLVELPLIERYVTIACVSNEVGGNLVGNAKWTGVRLMDVLDMAGIQAGATQIVPRSVDGWTAGFPTSWLTDSAREALIAVKMNDEPLPAEHGFPARLIVPGLYGYVSATKWLSDIELTTLEAFDAYWVPRGWAKEAPILTQSRIDVPRGDATVTAGPVAVAGVAWAPDRGISKVEVRVDDGAWQAATLALELSPSTWVQWKWTWQATAGDHVLEVRATDGTGEVQTDQASRPDPDGARGHHRIAVRVA